MKPPKDVGRYHLTAEQLAALDRRTVRVVEGQTVTLPETFKREILGAWDIGPPSEVTATETPKALADGKPRKRSGEYSLTVKAKP